LGGAGREQSGEFHVLHDLPKIISHGAHLNMNTMFLIYSDEMPSDREMILGFKLNQGRHGALLDASVVGEYFMKLVELDYFKALEV
jgi:hypothetical protein